MTNFSRPIVLTALALAFILAGIFGGPANDLDRWLIERAAELRADAPGFTQFVARFTKIGSAPITLGLPAITAVWLLLRRYRGAALLLAGTVIIERLLVDGMKDWIGRPRPSVEPLLHIPQSLAYPSGHAANSMTAFLAAALIAAPPAYRRAIAIAALILAFLIGCSRVLLGVHWSSDVIGGWVFGSFAVGIALAIGQRSGALLLEPQHDVVGRHRLPADEGETA